MSRNDILRFVAFIVAAVGIVLMIWASAIARAPIVVQAVIALWSFIGAYGIYEWARWR